MNSLLPLALIALVLVYMYKYVPAKPKKEAYCSSCMMK